MISLLDKKDCCGCNACTQKCPKQCIKMEDDDEGFLYPKVDIESCIDCGICNKVCPVINQKVAREPLEVYAAKNPNEKIRYESSSGGIFTMLAEHIIDNGGIVFGAGFDLNWEVKHQYTETKEGIAAFRGSKYVQSRIENTYKQAEAFLKQGREVLFSGTPCQIAGLKLFLRKDYVNLITVDFICHGVPSPGAWRSYLSETIVRIKSEAEKNTILLSQNVIPVIKKISFRDKRFGWKKFGLEIQIAVPNTTNNLITKLENLYESLRENAFIKGFLADLYLRPSCHACPTKELKSGSDITIADYWRIHELMPQLDDDKGISAVLINTGKGKSVFDTIDADKYLTTYDDVCCKNSALRYSSPIHPKRKYFFTPTKESFSNKVESLLRPSTFIRLKHRMKTIMYVLIRLLKK